MPQMGLAPVLQRSSAPASWIFLFLASGSLVNGLFGSACTHICDWTILAILDHHLGVERAHMTSLVHVGAVCPGVKPPPCREISRTALCIVAS